MDVAGLEHPACDIRLVEGWRPETVDRGRLVAKGGEEREREFGWIEGSAAELRYGFLDLNGVHAGALSLSVGRLGRWADMPARLHAFMQHADDLDEAWLDRPIEDHVHRV